MTRPHGVARGARRGAVAGFGVIALLLLAGCASTASPSAGADAATARTSSGTGAAVPSQPSGAEPSASTADAVAPAGPLSPSTPSRVDPPAGRDGRPAVVDRIDTDDPVVFLTIDDGWTADPALPDLLRRYGAHLTVFATGDAVADKTAYLRELVAAGATVQNHTLSHPDLRTVSSATARREICGASDRYDERFGTRPWLLRPPYGAYDDAALEAAADCGADYVVMWSVSQPGRYLRYLDGGSRLRPGDILLTHFGEHTAEYLERTLKMIQARGFTTGRLEDYLPARGA